MNNTNYFPGQGILHLLLNQDNQNELPSPEPKQKNLNKIFIQLQNKMKLSILKIKKYLMNYNLL